MPSINRGMNHYTCLIRKCSNLHHKFSHGTNHFTHFYGSTAIDANRIRRVVNLMLKESVRCLSYIVVYRKCDHYIADSLVWGLLRFAPINSTHISVYKRPLARLVLMLVMRLMGSVIYRAYSHAIQLACKPLTSDSAKSVKHTYICCT